ncbi:molybdopterin molybdotransferase MoeA [Aliikangiella coralliicola]|uniref:Molybdopterin molybdenumtransferase n=1 Tax=Aliikangiella coralliicola TaxID=2592383 RepID=A0A545UDH4_9GAMM|nr:molybdopterin molybdotransferase MoeA [Aliikangiella coralliicola]TQV87524.1 molybdopterin molybdotransferase MoeA [Aliikangiella coralliicola]
MNDNQSNRYTENYLIDFAQAQQLLIEHSSPVDTEIVDINDASGRVLAQSISSPVFVPPFNNSAMDGYAVNSQDLCGADQSNPISLELIGLTAAGDNIESITDTKGKAWKIMTGAPVPEGFDSIIPVENTQLEGNQVVCFSTPKLAAHIRKRGEDFSEGEAITSWGTIINANTVMAFAALGIAKVKVFKKVNVSVFSTGKELVDDPNQSLKPGQIRNSNKPFIFEWFKDLPVEVHDAGTNFDEVEKFVTDLQQELNKGTEIIISSGAVSMGDFDFIPQTIKKLGGEIIFHKSKIRPGKPILFAKFPNGSYYFGLPGNPISSAIGLRFFVSSLLRNILGLPQEKPLTAVVQNGMNKKVGFRVILKAAVNINSTKLETTILEGQESFKIKPLTQANGWAVAPENKETIEKGDIIDFYPTMLYWQ